MCSGLSQSSGFWSSGSGMVALSSQSSGLLWDGSLIFFGGRKSQSASNSPDSTSSLLIKTYETNTDIYIKEKLTIFQQIRIYESQKMSFFATIVNK